jgi:hypothetical protein
MSGTTSGFGPDFPVPRDRQWPLAIAYHVGINPADATAGVVLRLPPGAQVTGGAFNTIVAGTATAVHDNAATPLSLFGAVAGTVGNTPITLFPFYPSGAVLTVAATSLEAMVVIEYVVDGRQNENGPV